MSSPNGTETVTEVATQFGFSELGRFSVEYRKLFGESPSMTLHRASRAKSRNEAGANHERTELPPV
jgi:AraC-like DNA-binding protein